MLLALASLYRDDVVEEKEVDVILLHASGSIDGDHGVVVVDGTAVAPGRVFFRWGFSRKGEEGEGGGVDEGRDELGLEQWARFKREGGRAGCRELERRRRRGLFPEKGGGRRRRRRRAVSPFTV